MWGRAVTWRRLMPPCRRKTRILDAAIRPGPKSPRPFPPAHKHAHPPEYRNLPTPRKSAEPMFPSPGPRLTIAAYRCWKSDGPQSAGRKPRTPSVAARRPPAWSKPRRNRPLPVRSGGWRQRFRQRKRSESFSSSCPPCALRLLERPPLLSGAAALPRDDAGWGAYLLQCAGQHLEVDRVLLNYIGERNDPQNLALFIHHRNAAYLVFCHELEGPAHLVFRANTNRVAAHAFVYCRVRGIAARRDYRQAQVAVGYDSEQLQIQRVLHHRQNTGIGLVHQVGRQFSRARRGAIDGSFGHYFADFHEMPPALQPPSGVGKQMGLGAIRGMGLPGTPPGTQRITACSFFPLCCPAGQRSRSDCSHPRM